MDACAACGEEFTCGLKAGEAECWCARLPAVLPVPEAEAACLCPRCLREKAAAALGDCLGCAHMRAGRTKSGSPVYRCLRAESDPSFPRYPRLPRPACAGREG